MKKFDFIGVTTHNSAIMRVFPLWAAHLGLGEVRMMGHDLPVHAERWRYREVVETIRADPENVGGLVTTHKLDLFEACRDLFDYVDPWAEMCGEVSSLSKREGLFRAHAKDPISSGRALREFLPAHHWATTGGEVLLFGAGGSSLAISLQLLVTTPPDDRPSRVVVVNRSQARLEAMHAVHEKAGVEVPVEYVHNTCPATNDALLAQAPPGSLVVNATGMGKDSPGSPLTDGAVFPERALAWELNYRGQLEFLSQARRQQQARHLVVEDGWRYFVHGWTCVIEEAFDIPMPAPLVAELSAIALEARADNAGTSAAARKGEDRK